MSPVEASDLSAPPGPAVTLVTRSDLREFACSSVAAGALARASGGLPVDPSVGRIIPGGRRGELGRRAVRGG